MKTVETVKYLLNTDALIAEMDADMERRLIDGWEVLGMNAYGSGNVMVLVTYRHKPRISLPAEPPSDAKAARVGSTRGKAKTS